MQADPLTAPTAYPLARVGRGMEFHVLDPNGRTRCENGRGSTWCRRDSDGRYQDPRLVSEIHITGTAGEPTCRLCQKFLVMEIERRRETV